MPLRLDDSTIAAFESAYVESDSRLPDRTPALLSPALRRACRTADGTYLPILVRLAVGLGSRASSVKDVYELTIQDSPLQIGVGSLLWVENLRDDRTEALGRTAGFETNREELINT